MRKNILFPTDFSSNSLNALKVFFEKYAEKSEQYNVIFTTGYNLSNSITDLLFISKSRIVNSIQESEFRESLTILKNKFENQFTSAQFDVFTGYSQDSFNDYVSSYEVETICLGSESKFDKKAKRKCFDLRKYALKSKMEVVVIDPTYVVQPNHILNSNLQGVFEAAPVHS